MMGKAKASGRFDFTPFVCASAVPTDNADACLVNGWYSLTENAQGCPISGAPLFVAGAKNCIWQYAFDSQTGSELRRNSVDGGASWKPWEWENPPVADGSEYRTTARYDGRPVYAKRIVIQSAPNSAVATNPHGLLGIFPIAWEARAGNGETELVLPYCGQFTVGVDSTDIMLTTTEDYSGYAVEITLRYCKAED